MEQRTIEVLQVLISLCNTATFNCDSAGARKITIAIEAGQRLVEELSNPRVEEDKSVSDGPEEGDTDE